MTVDSCDILDIPGHVTVVDKPQLNFTVLPAANLNCHDHVTCFYNFGFSNRFSKVKVDIFRHYETEHNDDVI